MTDEPPLIVKRLYNILTDPWSDAKHDAIAEIEKNYDKDNLPHGDDMDLKEVVE